MIVSDDYEQTGVNPENAMRDMVFRMTCALTQTYPNIDLDGIRSVLLIVAGDYDITPKEKGLAVFTEGKNEMFTRQFALAKIASGRTKRTIEAYTNTLRMFSREIDKDFDTITHTDIQIWLARIMQRSSKVNANNCWRVLSTFYNWLYRERYVRDNPMFRVDSVKTPKKNKEAFSDMDIEKIRLSCRTWREKALVEVLLSTGCRNTELCQMRIEDINGNEILVLGKGEKYRTVYLNAKAQVAVEQYLGERTDDSPYLFPKGVNMTHHRLGGQKAREWYKNPEYVSLDPPNTSQLENVVRKIGKRAGVANCHPHRFRRTCATNALKHGMPIATVSLMLGHASIATTQIYLDLSGEDLAQSHKKYVV